MQLGNLEDHTAAFEHHRPRLLGLAYRMLGSLHDAEDVLQLAYLQWHGADHASVRSAEAWLVTVVTRLAIDRKRSLARERARYVGDWLPEPLPSAPSPPDARVELAADVSTAFLLLLERLSPQERAAFLLHDVFGAPYAELAAALDRSEAACRQLVHRARARVRDGRPRVEVPAAARERLVREFIAAIDAGDEQRLLALVADDATWTSDTGGKVPAAQRLRGAARIARFQLRLARKHGDAVRRELVWVNGEPAMALHVAGRLYGIVSVAARGDRLAAFYAVVNPDKLAHLVAG